MPILRTLVSLSVIATLSLSPIRADESCPLPDQQNVSYGSVTELSFRAPDQTVAYGDDDLQRAELWRTPLNPKAPVVALIHGGCWLNAFDIAHTRALSTALADAGYNVWSLEYRRTGDPGGGWPGTYDDILSGLNKLMEIKPQGFDLARVALAGHSAGGHLALLANTSTSLKLSPRLVLGLAPITDLSMYAAGDNSCQQATPAFMGGSSEQYPERYATASVSADNPANSNVMVLHGDLDNIVPLSQSEGFTREIIAGAGHFDFVHPHTPAFRTILRELAKHL